MHCFTDGTRLHLSFKPDGKVSQDVGVRAMERCVADTRSWMIDDRLLLNDDIGDNDITLLPVLEI